MTTKEAKIVLPVLDNNGESLIHAEMWLEETLINRYGGFTKSKAYGAWKSPNGTRFTEEVTVYAVAMDDIIHVAKIFLGIAHELCEIAEQEAIYVVTANGEVHYVEVE